MSETWAFFVRKFDVKRATLEQIIKIKGKDEAIDLLKEKVRQKLKAEITDIVEFVKVPYSQLSLEVVTHSYICKIAPNYKIPKSRNAGFYTIDEISKLRLTPVHHDIFLDYIAANAKI
jgi:hypothetical protein